VKPNAGLFLHNINYWKWLCSLFVIISNWLPYIN
jgi:hypothetical protein